MVKAEKRNGSIPPMNSPITTRASVTFIEMAALPSSAYFAFILSVNVEKRASAVSAAEPMAKPLPTAAVVFPTESSLSVISRTLSSRPDISAIPPALSAIGPYASTATVIPVVESIPTAARAIP